MTETLQEHQSRMLSVLHSWVDKVLVITGIKDLSFWTKSKSIELISETKQSKKNPKTTINGKNFPASWKDTSFRIKSDFKKPLTFQNKYKNRRPIIKIS